MELDDELKIAISMTEEYTVVRDKHRLGDDSEDEYSYAEEELGSAEAEDSEEEESE